MWVIEEEMTKVSFCFIRNLVLLWLLPFILHFWGNVQKRSRGRYFEDSPLENGVIITILFVVDKKRDECVFLLLFFVVIIQIAFPELKFLHILWWNASSPLFVLQMERETNSLGSVYTCVFISRGSSLSIKSGFLVLCLSGHFHLLPSLFHRNGASPPFFVFLSHLSWGKSHFCPCFMLFVSDTSTFRPSIELCFIWMRRRPCALSSSSKRWRHREVGMPHVSDHIVWVPKEAILNSLLHFI